MGIRQDFETIKRRSEFYLADDNSEYVDTGEMLLDFQHIIGICDRALTRMDNQNTLNQIVQDMNDMEKDLS